MSVFAKLIGSMVTLDANCRTLRREFEPGTSKDNFDPDLCFELVKENEQIAARLPEELLTARLDEQQQKIEALRTDVRPKTPGEILAEIAAEFHNRCEELDPNSICASVERQAWHRALGIVERYMR